MFLQQDRLVHVNYCCRLFVWYLCIIRSWECLGVSVLAHICLTSGHNIIHFRRVFLRLTLFNKTHAWWGLGAHTCMDTEHASNRSHLIQGNTHSNLYFFRHRILLAGWHAMQLNITKMLRCLVMNISCRLSQLPFQMICGIPYVMLSSDLRDTQRMCLGHVKAFEYDFHMGMKAVCRAWKKSHWEP